MTVPAGRRAGIGAHWLRWRKYPVRHLLVGAAYRAWRLARSRWRRPPPLLLPLPGDDLADLVPRALGIPRPVAGAGIPAHAPFRPRERAVLLAAADAARARRIDLLGSGPTDIGFPIDWHRDFKSGAQWPRVPVRHLRHAIVPGADVKVPWELGRFHHAAPLILAYLETGEPVWATEFLAQVGEFLDANPVGIGVQWTSAMDTAIRASTWSWALAVIAGAGLLDDGLAERWLGSLRQHGWWIRGHLSWNPHSRGNHYLTELVGLLHVGLVLGWTREGRRWARFAARRIRSEMRHQVREDGLDGEASTNYHRFVTELFAQAAALVRSTDVPLGLDPDPVFDRRLEAMLRTVESYTRPDGTAPLVGDVDDGRLLAFAASEDPRRHLETLVPYGAGMPADRSAAWPEGGLFALRGSSALVLIRCGPVGLYGRGAHDHADQLSVDVTLGGVPLFVDPGTYQYTADPQARQAFRATRAHNTVEVDGRDQMTFTPLSLFEVERGAEGTMAVWDESEGGTRFEGSHDGYVSGAAGIVHTRHVELRADGKALTIGDRLSGPPGRHAVRATWQCDPGVQVPPLQPNGRRFTLRRDGGAFEVACAGDGALAWRMEEGWVAPRYGVRVPAPRLVLEGTVAVPASWTVTIALGASADHADAVTRSVKP